MYYAQPDPEWVIASDPRISPQQLADLAARRWDLHARIAANPRTYPALRQWIAAVNPNSMMGAQVPPAAPAFPGARPVVPGPRPRRRGGSGWLIGGICCTVVVLMIALLSSEGAGRSHTSDADVPDAGAHPSSAPDDSGGSEVEAQLAIFESEREQFYDLVARLDGNPVAPLVTRLAAFQRLEERASRVGTNDFAAQTVAQQAQQHREDVQALVAAADARRVNSSGSVSEGLVDDAGDGFIDIGWDAASVCPASDREEWSTIACVGMGDSLTVHLRSESEFTSDWELRMIVMHELSHVYQRADAARFTDRYSDADRLLEQGLFQGNQEMMADCYALTYYDEWTLETDDVVIGYGYVCSEAERDAIREWAATIDAPMPG